MNIIKITLLSLSLATSYGIYATTALAAEATASSSVNVSETISHLEKALVEIAKSDFNTAQVHLKAARTSGEKITGSEIVVKQAGALVIQGQIKAKLGDIKAASEELNKALALYKSL
ncbi:hypothetical protein [Methylomonas albis]|uniref:Uncharacterized protein n=1 Tax=Methylomonas albis TaxID=1854563 RepID=A0ABR9D1Q5_9GAMM|nr:hypothetical protein [Methylomonas albis]MBD9357063.1 hypothetical protein [Methylomonas albis]